MISFRDKLIFVHINKTGGTSVETAFHQSQDKSNDQYIPEKIIDDIGLSKWQNCFTCAFVRNPWDRFVSEYFFRKTSPLCPQRVVIDSGMTFREFVMERRDAMHNPSTPKSELIRFQSQILWLVDRRGQLMVDYVGMFEHLQSSYNRLLEACGRNYPLPHVNRTKHEPYSHYYDEETIEIVRELHSHDIQVFGYEFGKPVKQVEPPLIMPFPGWNSLVIAPRLRLFQ